MRLASVVPRTLRPAYHALICAQDPRVAQWRDGGGPGCHWGMGFRRAGVGVRGWPGAWGRSGWRAEAPGGSWLCGAGRGMEEGLRAAGTLSTGRELSDLPSVAVTRFHGTGGAGCPFPPPLIPTWSEQCLLPAQPGPRGKSTCQADPVSWRAARISTSCTATRGHRGFLSWALGTVPAGSAWRQH